MWGRTQVGTHLPVYLMQQNTSAVAPCTPSVRCDPQYATVAAGVVAIYVVDIATRTVGLCSGLACPPLRTCALVVHSHAHVNLVFQGDFTGCDT